jgi:hypothetical protein
MRRAQYWMTCGAIGLLAITIAGCREVSAPNSDRCAQPAPLLGRYDPAAPGFIVQYRDGVDAVGETSRLASKYGFTSSYVYTAALHGFAALLTADVVATLRCEGSVASVEHDSLVHAD